MALSKKGDEVVPIAKINVPDWLVVCGNPHSGEMGLSFETVANGSQPVEVRMAMAALWMRKAVVSILQNSEAAQVYARLIAQAGVQQERDLDPGEVN